MSEFNAERQIWLALNLDHLVNDLELAPLSVNEIMSASLIELLLPKV